MTPEEILKKYNTRELWGEDPYDSWDIPDPVEVHLGGLNQPNYEVEINMSGRDYENVRNQLERILKMPEHLDLSRTEAEMEYTPDHILRSGDRTIVFWLDGTKTIVKRGAVDCPDDYHAFCAALAIKIFGTNSHLKKMLKDKTYIQKKVHGKNKVFKKSDLYDPLEGYEE